MAKSIHVAIIMLVSVTLVILLVPPETYGQTWQPKTGTDKSAGFVPDDIGDLGKFDPGFYDLVQKLIQSQDENLRSGPAYHDVVIVVNKYDQDGTDISEANKDAVVKILGQAGAQNITAADLLSFVTASVPVSDILEISGLGQVYRMGDGQAQLTPAIDRMRLTIGATLDDLRRPGGTVVNGSGVTVGVMDTGINHPDGINGKVIDRVMCNDYQCSYVPASSVTGFDLENLQTSHGTRVAMIIAGSGLAGNNGIAPGVDILDAGVMRHYGVSGTLIDLSYAFEWLLGMDADVSNMSLSLGRCNDISSYTTAQLITAEAVDSGMPVVVSAGNYGAIDYTVPLYKSVSQLACAHNVITVGGIDDRDPDNVEMYVMSSRGPASHNVNGTIHPILKPEVVAPSHDILVPKFVANDATTPGSGTSYAAPAVTAVAAMTLQERDMEPAAVKAAILLGADWTGPVPCTSVQYEENNPADNCSHARQPQDLEVANDADSLKIINNVGFGILDAGRTLDYVTGASGNHIVEADLHSEADVDMYRFDVSDTENPVKVILSWTSDTFWNHILFEGSHYFADLGFTVDCPGMDTISAQSAYQSNEFAVFVPAEAGTCTVTVTGSGIDTPRSSEQNYALASTLPLSSTGDTFVTTWSTAVPGESITIPVGEYAGRYTVDWGDGSASANVTGNQAHAYDATGTYTVSISGNFTRIDLSGDQNNAEKLQSIEQWGDIPWDFMGSAFKGASNMAYSAIDTPNLSSVTNMTLMFSGASSFDGDLSTWDVSGVTDMTLMFSDASSFDGDLSTWDVSGVTDMTSMFSDASSFNGDISGWNVSNVIGMSSMFDGADSFVQNLGAWYIIIDDTPGRTGDWDVSVGSIAAQNAYLDSQSPLYSIGSGGDSDYFVTDGSTLVLKAGSDLSEDRTYSVNIASTGSFGTGNTRTVEVVINDSPVVVAGADLSVTEGSIVNLSGMASDTYSVGSLKYEWSHDDSVAIPFDDPSSPSTWFQAPYVQSNTTVTLTLTVSDGLISSADTVDVTILETGKEPFVTTWHTMRVNDSITIPVGDATGTYTVDWGDDTASTHTEDANHVYDSAGAYTVSISGNFTSINLGDDKSSVAKLYSIDQWGTIQWDTMKSSFSGAYYMVYNATDAPDLSGVTDMSNMFGDTYRFNGDLTGWNTSSVTDMSSMFEDAPFFDGDLSTWDVSEVTNMKQMFSGAFSFNGNLSGWDVSNVIHMQDMFHASSSFDGDLSTWDVSSVTDMSSMFSGASSFNSDLSDWDVSNVIDMLDMFHGASSFNGDISDWDVSNVTYMQDMFQGASSFNSDLSDWDVSNVTYMREMFSSATSFNGDLSDWDVSEVTHMTGMFSSATSFNGDLSDWDVSKVTSMQDMFYGATSFNGDLSDWDVSKVTSMREMFSSATSFNGDLSDWDVSNVTSMQDMFRDASSFDQNLGNWYVVLDNTTIDYDDASGIVGNISAQNSFLNGQNPVYGISDDDSDSFELNGSNLRLKVIPAKSSYTVTITSTGHFGSDNSRTLDIVFSNFIDNGQSIVDAGSDQTVDEGSLVTLNATVIDADGDAMTYKWTHDSSLPISLADGAALSTTFTAPEVTANTTVTFTLTVSDGTDSNFDAVAVTVSDVNRAPAVDAGSDQTVDEGSLVTLNATVIDADGDAMTYKWTHDSSLPISLADGAALSTTFTAPEVTANTTVTFTLTVSDGTDSNFDAVAVTVSDVNRAPAVDAGSDQTVDEGSLVTLNATVIDADGDAMTYKWTHDSSLPISLADGAALSTTFTAPEVTANTTVTFTLTVSDGTDSNFDAVAVTVSDVNRAPAVDAGSDQTVDEGSLVTLNATVIDADGDAMTYKWTHDSGLPISLADGAALSTTFTAPEVTANTTVTFTLTVSDGTDSNFDAVAVTVSDVNRAPAVDAGSDQTVDEGSLVTLNATVIDADGDAMTYKWTHDSSLPISLADGAALSTTFTAPEVTANTTVTFTLTVSDGTDSNFDAVAVTVSDVNRTPAVDAGSDQTVDEGSLVTLNATVIDADGDAMTYKWTHDSGLPISLADGAALSTTFTAPTVNADTTITFTLTADDGTATVTDSTVVTINYDDAPVVDAGSDQPAVRTGDTVTLSGTASDDDSTSLTYLWTHDSDLTISFSNATALSTTFLAPAVDADTAITFTLAVDDGTTTATDSLVVTVADVPAVNSLPVINAGSDQIVKEGTSVTLAGTAADSDGDSMTYLWSQTAGSPTVALTGADTLLPVFTAPAVSSDTEFIFELAVSDDSDRSTDTVKITVRDVPDDAPFVTTWKTTTAGKSITIPVGDASGTYTVDWGDGNTSVDVTGDQRHTYDDAGSHTVSISGDFTKIYLNGQQPNADKLWSINQWGDIRWESMESAFAGASNMRYKAPDAPDLSRVTDMSGMFGKAVSFNGDLSAWDTSSVTDMSGMFSYARPFNGDLSAWDTSSVTDMSEMFKSAASFNGDLSAWDTSSVTDTSGMFSYTYSFNGDLSAWNASSVTDTSRMFFYALPFNGDLSAWDTSSVTDMSGMFTYAYAFNGDLSAWDTSSVTDMSEMFKSAASFNGDISNWNVSSATDMDSMFHQANSFKRNLGNWYITLDDISIASGDAPGVIGRITAQNSYLNGQNPTYGISSGGDSDSFELDGNKLKLKTVPTKSLYTVSVTATGDFDRSNSKIVTVTVTDILTGLPPQVDAGIDQTVREGQTVTLNGTATDNNGDTLTYEWTHDSSLAIHLANSTSPSTTFAAPAVGADTDVTFTLAVSDGTTTVSDGTVITVRYNDPPSVGAGADQIVGEGAAVTLSGTATDDEGDQLTYEWTHDSDLTISFSNATVLSTTFLAPAVDADTVITFTLAVDDGTTTATDSLVVTVADVPAVNNPLVIDAGSDQIVKEGTSVTLAGTAADSDGDSMTYLWSQTAGSPTVALTGADTLLPVFTAPAVSSDTEFIFELAVSDDSDRSTDTVKITVRDVPDDAPFVTTWKTTTAGKSITIPVGDASGTYTVDWGDGNTSVDVTGDQRHTYDDAGSHTVSISGDFTKIYLNGQQPNADKLWSINQWGDIRWESMESAFAGASNMRYKAPDAPDLSRVTDMSGMFGKAVSFNGDLSAWDTSSVTDMSGMFSYARPFNGDLSAWDTSSVTDMSEMFKSTASFNGDLSAWDTSSVTDMSGMFSYTYSFNGDLSAWNASSVTDTSRMFFYALPFNGDLSAWNASSVTDMSGMFTYAYAFNGDLSAWDTSSVTDTSGMFKSAASFNGDLSAWNVSRAERMDDMFQDASLFDQNLGNWYIVLDDVVIDGSSVPGEVGRISAQNSFLDDQNLTYGIGSGGDSAHFAIDGSSILKIKSVPDGHAGPYSVTITSTGTYGSENSRTFEISVTEGTDGAPSEVPSDPRDVGEITLSSTESGTIEVTWDAPGETPRDYRVSWAKAGENFLPKSDRAGNAFTTSPGHTVTDLEEGEEYKVKVRARYNGGGAGDWSDIVTITVAGT